MVRTRFAPSPTGSIHIGNLRTALYEYLIAKSQNGKFILRIEDTDKERFVEKSINIIYKTLKMTNLKYDEGPDIGGEYGPYIQSERKKEYIKYAKKLIENKQAYYCFCTKKRLESLNNLNNIIQYDRHCLNLTEKEIKDKLENNEKYVIRQMIPEGKTKFYDEVYGKIIVDNSTLDDQILIKSDGLPTYNFANVIDDHKMKITHVVRGSEYLSSTPKYNLLYRAFNWEIPKYIHLPLILNTNGEKLSKRKGDASFEDLVEKGFLPEAIINYIALLGWSPKDNKEIFTLKELIENFDIKRINKAPCTFDIRKLTWINSEYIKNFNTKNFYELSKPFLISSINKPNIDLKKVASMVQSRISFLNEIPDLINFINEIPKYTADLYENKKMKTTKEISIENLEKSLIILTKMEKPWTKENLHNIIFEIINKLGIKNSQMLWPLRTALSGKNSSPCGAIELLELLGKEESILRIQNGINILKK